MPLQGPVDTVARRLLHRLYDAYRQADSADLSIGMRAGDVLSGEGYTEDDGGADLLKILEAVRLLKEQGLVEVPASPTGGTPYVKPSALGMHEVALARRNPIARALSHMWERQAVPAAVAGAMSGAVFGYLASFLHGG